MNVQFPNKKFITAIYVPPCDRNSNAGSMLLLVMENILAKFINNSLMKDFEGLLVELNIRT